MRPVGGGGFGGPGMGMPGRFGGPQNFHAPQFHGGGDMKANLTQSQSGVTGGTVWEQVDSYYKIVSESDDNSALKAVNYVRASLNLPFFASRTIGPMLQKWSMSVMEENFLWMPLAMVPFTIGTALLLVGAAGGFATTGIFLDMEREADATWQAQLESMKGYKPEMPPFKPDPKDYFENTDPTPSMDPDDIREALKKPENAQYIPLYKDYLDKEHHEIFDKIEQHPDGKIW